MAYIFAQEIAVPGLEWVALPIIADVDKAIIRMVLDALSKSIVMQAFFLNTAIRKAAQAQDFVDSVNNLNSLPADTSQEDYKNAEIARSIAFRNFVAVTN